MDQIYSGFLTKSPPEHKMKRPGPFKSRWKRRFFVLYAPPVAATNQFLKGSHACLEYYKDKDQKERKASIALKNCQQVCDRLESGYYKFLFSIITPLRTYYLAADTEIEMDTWVDRLISVLGLENGGSLEIPKMVSGDTSQFKPVPSSVKLQNTNSRVIVGSASFSYGGQAKMKTKESDRRAVTRQSSEPVVSTIVEPLQRMHLGTVKESVTESKEAIRDTYVNDDRDDIYDCLPSDSTAIPLDSDSVHLSIPIDCKDSIRDTYVNDDRDDIYDCLPSDSTAIPLDSDSVHLSIPIDCKDSIRDTDVNDDRDDTYDCLSSDSTVVPLDSDSVLLSTPTECKDTTRDTYVNDEDDDNYDHLPGNSMVVPPDSESLYRLTTTHRQDKHPHSQGDESGDSCSSEELVLCGHQVDDKGYDLPPPAAHVWIGENVHSYVNAAAVFHVKGADYVMPRREVFGGQSHSNSGVFEIYTTARTRSFCASSPRNSQEESD